MVLPKVSSARGVRGGQDAATRGLWVSILEGVVEQPQSIPIVATIAIDWFFDNIVYDLLANSLVPDLYFGDLSSRSVYHCFGRLSD